MVKINFSKTDLLLLRFLTGDYQTVKDVVARVFEYLDYLENNKHISKAFIPDDVHIFYVTLDRKLQQRLKMIQCTRSGPLIKYKLKPQYVDLPRIISEMKELEWIKHSQTLGKNDIKILRCCSSETKNSTGIKSSTRILDKKSLQDKLTKLIAIGLLEETKIDNYEISPIGKQLLEIIYPSTGTASDVGYHLSAENSVQGK